MCRVRGGCCVLFISVSSLLILSGQHSPLTNHTLVLNQSLGNSLNIFRSFNFHRIDISSDNLKISTIRNFSIYNWHICSSNKLCHNHDDICLPYRDIPHSEPDFDNQ